MRCVEYYDRCEKEGCDWCDKDRTTVQTIEEYIKFYKLLESHGVPKAVTIVAVPEGAVRPLIRERDTEIREKAISHVKNVLKRETPTGGKYKEALTAKDIKQIVEQVKKEKREEQIAALPKGEEKQEEEKNEGGEKTTEEKTEETKEMSMVDNRPPQTKSVFNETGERVEWAKWTWNPVTGCKHGCKYCYARDMAMRWNKNAKDSFEPAFHPERLCAPVNMKLPKENGNGERNVFVCSMADLFGDWVPQEWIDAVMKAVLESPSWNYIFLTKNPKRLPTIKFPRNAWVGTTVDTQTRVKAAEDAFKDVVASVKFVSVEPMMERITFKNIDVFDWVIIGGRSASSGMAAGQPDWEWVEHLLIQARKKNLKVYFKPNLTVRPKEYPGAKNANP